MSQLAPVAGLVGTGLSIYSTVHQAQAQSAQVKAQNRQIQQQAAAQSQLAAAQQQQDTRARQDQLAGTLASIRARSAAEPSFGSRPEAAVAAGLQKDSAQDIAEDDAVRNARLAAGRRSLLNNDGSLTTWLRAGSSFAGAAKSLLG